MQRLLLLLTLLLLTASGCSLAEGIFWFGGHESYSAGSDFESRKSHFDAEHDRWRQYEYER